MAKIEEYLKNGKTHYKFQVYIGTNPETGKKQRTTRRGFTCKKEARSVMLKLELDINNGLFEKRTYETYHDFYDLWIEQYRNTVRESTFIKTSQLFKNRILPLIGHMRIQNISIIACQQCVNQWFRELPASYRKVTNYASSVFRLAMKMEVLQKNPMELVTLPVRLMEADEVSNENFYDKGQVLKFLDCVKSEDNLMIYSFFRILIYTGIRQGEALALTWEDVDFDEKFIKIGKTLARGFGGVVINAPKTRASKREVSIDDETVKLLLEWQTEQKRVLRSNGNKPKTNQLLFSSKTNKLFQNTRPRKWLIKILNKYDLPEITVHGFRHTHSSLLLEAGAQLIDVKDKLGHSSIKTTADIYSHFTKEKRDKTFGLFQEHLSAY